MKYNEALNKFVIHLSTKEKYKHYTTGWANIPCPFCDKDGHKNHLYIHIPNIDSPGRVSLKCFKPGCEFAEFNRTIKPEDFELLGFTDTEAIKVILSEMKKLPGLPRLASNNKDYIPLIYPKKYNHLQVEYFYKRTKIKITDTIIDKYKVILDIKEFIKLNKDVISVDSYKTLSDIKVPVIGFICNNNQGISIRGINNSLKMQIKFNNNDESLFYSIDESEYNSYNNIVISDGIFDIINAQSKYAILPNTMYAASLNKDKFINLIVSLGLNCKGEYLIVFEDNIMKNKEWIPDTKMYKSYKRLNYIFKNIFVVYNESNKVKDLGDMSEEHIPTKIKIS